MTESFSKNHERRQTSVFTNTLIQTVGSIEVENDYLLGYLGTFEKQFVFVEEVFCSFEADQSESLSGLA